MNNVNFLKKKASQIRLKTCELSNKAKAAHLGSALSVIDILVCIFFSKIFKIKKNNKYDKFILSKGHAAAALYSCLAEKGFIKKIDLNKFGKKNSIYEEHPNFKINGVLTSTGSLGHGLSFGAGIALAEKIKNKNNKIITLLSDGECNEGAVWEAAGFASAKNLNHLIALIDYNKWQATGKSDEIFGGNLKSKWMSFGWKTYKIKGNHIPSILKILKKTNKKKPIAIICDTIKGSGIKFMENDNNWHYRVPNKKELDKIKLLLNI
jgi:transketolase